MCDHPRLPEEPVYGGNDWCCNYGESSFEKILTHAKRIAACAPQDGPRPYMVVLSKSGTPLFVSIADDAFTPGVQADITAAFACAAKPAPVSRSLGWMDTPLPFRWESAYGTNEYF